MTREEAIKELTELLPEEFLMEYSEAIRMAIKALEQEPILDKIRAEIEALPKVYPFVNHIDTYVKEDDVKKIIDKCKAESEV